ncbi:filamentous hemagglutinin N-terminal domain-containing protein [Ramlibacter sp.]|uniref:two-partner secretion domain-containing protein n=1 Tax=Ramlibacter sp. TaxID=1917967 RepID=UPI00262D6D68|nr:filamentous hemagglutinin N-terminal domain-containing protein [Ramlibacter sp.]MDB5953940.1 hypothetical protein [Ramlibacter sp.]
MSSVPSRPVRTVARRRAVRTPVHAGFRPAAAALAVAAVFAGQCGTAAAQATGAQVIAGQASLVRSGNNLVVTTQNAPGTNHSALNWQSFSVPAGSITQFDQPSAASTSINRVVGPDPSAIFGTLRSNGRLVLVNPAGIAVGTGAVVDTAGFTASTLQMSEADAIAGRMRFSNQGNSAGLTVGGTIRAQGGDIVLVAPNVQTASTALIQSDGATILAAGQKVEISGRGLEGIHLDVQAGDQAVNLGTLRGDAVGIFAGTLRHSGLVQAQAVSIAGGKVVLQATGGDSLVDGRIEARATGGKGGSIDVLGERVGLLAGALLDASGASGGGQVRVGGDYRGANAAVPNAARTYVDADATIQADATQQGDGGRVIVWSDEVTRMYGQISARGGAQGGNGGFAEVSGKQGLEYTGWVDLRAPLGTMGTLLLDSEDVTIFHDTPLPEGTLPPVYPAVNIDDAVAGVFRPLTSGTVTLLSDAKINYELTQANVLVTTSTANRYSNYGTGGQITIDPNAVITWGTASHLTLQADKGIDVNGNINATHPDSLVHLTAGNGSLSVAGGASITAGSVALETLSGAAGYVARDVNIDGYVQANSGALSVSTAGAVNVGRYGSSGSSLYGSTGVTVTAGSDIYFSPQSSVYSYGGPISVVAGNNITGSGTFSTSGSSGNPDSLVDGSITLDAQRGSLSFNVVDSSGYGYGYGAQDGGNVTLHAASDITGNAIRAVGASFFPEGEGEVTLLARIYTAAPLPTTSTVGNGGKVSVTADTGSVSLHRIDTRGGSVLASDDTASRDSVSSALSGAGGEILVTAGQRIVLDGQGLSAPNTEVPGTSGPAIASGPVTLRGDNVTIAALTDIASTGNVQITAGALVLDGTISSAAAGNALVLSAQTLQVGQGGGIATPSGRWLIYLPNPDGLRFVVESGDLAPGALPSGNMALWNRSFASAAPASITEAGNRYVFALQPEANITVGSASKVYDGTLGFRGLDVFVDGLVDASLYGNVFLQDLATGILAAPALSKNVGSYALTQGSLGVAGYAVHFTGGALTITPAALTISANDATKLEGDTLRFNGSEFTTSGLIAGESVPSVTVASAGASASAKPDSYAITASAAAAGPAFLPSNYTISYRDGALLVAPAGISPPPVSVPVPSSAPVPVTVNNPVNNQVVTFAHLFVQEAIRQQDEKKDIGKDAIVITDTACKP